MSARLMAICFVILFLTQCRSTNSQLKQDPALGVHANYKLLNGDFDWLGEDNGAGDRIATRSLIYCKQKGTDNRFVEAFARAIKRMDKVFENQAVKWTISAASLIDCPDNWSLREKQLKVIPHLRIRQEAMAGTIKPTVAHQSLSFDSSSIDSPVLQNEKVADPNDKAYGMHPQSVDMAQSHVAKFTYDKLLGNLYIISGEIVFNSHESIVWDSEVSDKPSVDTDLVALHMLGHVLKLSHSDDIFDDVQLLPCGAKVAADNISRAPTAVKASQDKNLITIAMGDDQRLDQSIDAGANLIVESSKEIPIMFPFFRLGTHCANSTSIKAEERYNFTKLEKDTLLRTAIIDGT